MIDKLIERLDEQNFEDVFQPLSKEELHQTRGWPIFSHERTEVKHLGSYDEVREYSKMSKSSFNSCWRQGYNFYGLRDKRTGKTYVVLVSLDESIRVLDSEGESVKYVM